MLRESFENAPGNLEDENETEKIERDPRLVALWNKYKFLGDPPSKEALLSKDYL